MSNIHSKLQRIAAQKVLADIQIDDSVLHRYGRNQIDSLLAGLEPFVTREWWLAGYRMYISGKSGLPTVQLSGSPFGWSFSSDGRLVCKVNLTQQVSGTFVFIWVPGTSSTGPQLRLYYTGSDDPDSLTVTSPHKNPPTKQAGAMASIPEPEERNTRVEMPNRLSALTALN